MHSQQFRFAFIEVIKRRLKTSAMLKIRLSVGLLKSMQIYIIKIVWKIASLNLHKVIVFRVFNLSVAYRADGISGKLSLTTA
jgi:hypothetical protein